MYKHGNVGFISKVDPVCLSSIKCLIRLSHHKLVSNPARCHKVENTTRNEKVQRTLHTKGLGNGTGKVRLPAYYTTRGQLNQNSEK